MKNFVIGLAATLTLFSAQVRATETELTSATECTSTCTQVSDGSIVLKALAALSELPNCATVKKAFTRTCVVTTGDLREYARTEIQGLEVVEQCEIVMRESGRKEKLSSVERRIAKQDRDIEKKLVECSTNL